MKTEVAVKQLVKDNVDQNDVAEFMAEAQTEVRTKKISITTICLLSDYLATMVTLLLFRMIPAHPNVVLFRGVTIPPDPISIVTDFCGGGSLLSYLRRQPDIPMETKVQIIKDIAKGMVR